MGNHYVVKIPIRTGEPEKVVSKESMDKNHFAVRAQGRQTVHVYFSQTEPLTSCVAKITIRDGEEIKHKIIAQGASFFNPKDKWDEMTGKRKAFGKMKENLGSEKPTLVFYGDGLTSYTICELAQYPRVSEKLLPTEREFEKAFFEWMKEN